MKNRNSILLFLLLLVSLTTINAQKESDQPIESIKDISLSGLKFRGIGPAITGEELLILQLTLLTIMNTT